MDNSRCCGYKSNCCGWVVELDESLNQPYGVFRCLQCRNICSVKLEKPAEPIKNCNNCLVGKGRVCPEYETCRFNGFPKWQPEPPKDIDPHERQWVDNHLEEEPPKQDDEIDRKILSFLTGYYIDGTYIPVGIDIAIKGDKEKLDKLYAKKSLQVLDKFISKLTDGQEYYQVELIEIAEELKKEIGG